MIDAIKLGRILAEEVVNEPGICFYPATFKPPHKGHYAVAMELISRNYITELQILISDTVTEGITPEDAMTIWKMYVGSNPKIVLQIAKPMDTMMKYAYKHPDTGTIYVAVSDDETDDIHYLESLQKTFGDKIKAIAIHDKAENDTITAPHVRELLRLGDYEEFAKTIPEQAYNKGYANKIFKMLAPKTTEPSDEQQ